MLSPIKFIGIYLLLLLSVVSAKGQENITISSEYGPKSAELLDYYQFEKIDYFRMRMQGNTLAGKKFLIISKEYWNSKVTKTDTCVNSGRMGIKADTSDFSFAVMSKKENKDTVKFMFFFPRFMTTRQFKATQVNSYSLRDPFNGKKCEYNADQTIMLLVLSLPYKDPKNPGWSSYCELSSKGVPPAEWGTKYGVEHYITFELKLE
ncbi:MAG: hypothetical protein JNN25_19075 [Candidatus Kapabacteria bacterium]|nr:hypothetical protein [Candidatus Kapabacteria bacterium]